MRHAALLALFAAAAVLALPAAASPSKHRDPLAALGRPSRYYRTTSHGYKLDCEEWEYQTRSGRPAEFIARCIVVGRAGRSKPKPAAGATS